MTLLRLRFRRGRGQATASGAYFRYVSTDATTTRAFMASSSMPTRDTRTRVLNHNPRDPVNDLYQARRPNRLFYSHRSLPPSIYFLARRRSYPLPSRQRNLK